MDQLIKDRSDVAIQLNDMQASVSDAEDHQRNLLHLLKRLGGKGLHCWLEKCHSP